ncbi:MAG: sigma 54-interacting transcriptional regulator [Deltaproteobacteria bacterium]|nr:sigma 54-interacting transcriptional regulator [Deltaproteobacteria bacterium]
MFSATLPKPAGTTIADRRGEPMLFLVLEAGRPPAGSARLVLGQIDRVEIGRGATRTLVREGRTLTLRLPDPWLSTRHAAIERRGASFHLVDLGSRNGSLLNGAPAQQAALADGDVLELGQTFFRFRAAVLATDDVADVVDARDTPSGTVLPRLEQRLAELDRIAASQVAVVIRGPSGAGKEVLASALHARSGRAGPFVAVNCGALPDSLVEAELFGHKKGAFSGAEARVGLIASAHRGTLFLDEIGDLPLAVQPALLRVLQDRQVTPLGQSAAVASDFRVVCATHRDLPELVASGEFREDLWARLSGFTIELPALADRSEDLATIIAALCARLAPGRPIALSVAAARALVEYHWPRNVRELEKTLEAAIALSPVDELDLSHLAAAAPGLIDTAPSAPSAPDPRRTALVAALREHNGNVSAVARAMAKPRSQIQRWMRRWNLRSGDFGATGDDE